jgi:Zn-dependent peptidase ImmA (M78 family)
MKDNLRTAIDNYSVKVIDKYEINIPCDSLEKIVTDKLHGKISEVSNLSSDSDGYISQNKESFIITIPKNQPLNRKNFTIAHELGHLFLHMGFGTSTWNIKTDLVYNRLGNTEEEYEANEFAASLLMPREAYTTIFKKHISNGLVDIDAIANFFHVSSTAAANRGRWLHLIQW